ncbi:MAG: indole-3-glycerol phosphate synthase TrpC [Desulfarculus sp.]|nr:indole-3-glycerol phosphate synthase TrpC [Desulfarculus sp.]
MPSVLARILASKRQEVAALRTATPLADLRRQALDTPAPRDFLAALKAAPGAALIAEIKRSSPSAGGINQGVAVAGQALAYALGGAAALSVLTDGPFFGGSLADLKEARAAVSLPILRKDFIIDEAQVYEARAAGADAVLLIVAALTPARLADLYALAGELGLTALIEVHGEDELAPALALKPPLLGINNRDLKTLAVSLDTCLGLRPLVPAGVTVVAESGIETPADVARLHAGGLRAFLVGSALMRAGDPRGMVASLVAAVPA